MQSYSKSYIYAGSRTYSPLSTGKEAKQYHHPDRLGTQLVTTGASSSFRQTTFPLAVISRDHARDIDDSSKKIWIFVVDHSKRHSSCRHSLMPKKQKNRPESLFVLQ